MKHRGPDDLGTFCDNKNSIYFAHRRLSILDVTYAGHQPMASEDGSVVVTYNGEIYNFLEIREELRGRGHSFRTACDTEVLIHAYQEWGGDCWNYFNGMFAFGLWDARLGKLILVRDRLGVKPLYYHEYPQGLSFASEVKTLRAIPGLKLVQDERHIPAFLRTGYVTGENTFFQGVRKLLPGHSLEVVDGRVFIKPYWKLSFNENKAVSEIEWEEEVSALLHDSVRLRLRSDVPVGVFLSGGLDSSTIVAALAGRSRIKSFSVAYRLGEGYDETPYARLVARRYGTDHHEYFITPEEFRDFIPRFVWFMDEPMSEAAGISLYYIARLASEHVKVILSGEGADEIFAGYDIYKYMIWTEIYRRIPEPLRKAIPGIVHLGIPSSGRVRKYVDLAALSLEKRYRGVNMLPSMDVNRLLDLDRWAEFEDPEEEVLNKESSASRGWPALNRLLHLDTKTWLPDDILIKADKMTMANSLELRVPFLDYRLVEKAASMPCSMKIRGNEKKRVLKRIVQGRVPDEIIRRKKLGFPTPVATMFRGPLNSFLKDVLLDRKTQQRGYFNYREVEKIIGAHEKGIDFSQLLWRLLVLEEWHRVFVDA